MNRVGARVGVVLSAFSLTLTWVVAGAAVPSSAAVTCTYDSVARTASVAFAGSDSVTVARDAGGTILVNGNNCPSLTDSSVATVATTDTVNATEAGPATTGNTNLTIDLANGGFQRPSAPDVHFAVTLGNLPGDTLTVASAGATGSVIAGSLGLEPPGTGVEQTGVNLNGDEASANPDVDVRATGIQRLTMNGISTSAVLSAAGGGAVADGTLTAPDNRSLFAGPANVPVTLNGKTGADLLIGGNAGDAINGDPQSGGGDDEIRGGAGEDTLAGGPGDDLIVGGPGNDTENGAAGNDVWVQGSQSVYQAKSPDVPKNVTDTKTITSFLYVDDRGPTNSTMFDFNARVCLTSPNNSLSTKELTVQVASPPQAAELSPDGATVTKWAKPNGINVHLVTQRTQSGVNSVFCYGMPSSGVEFDSDAYTRLSNAASCSAPPCRSFDGRFHPEDSLELFDMSRAVGYQPCTARCPAVPSNKWKLTVADGMASGGVRWTLQGWSIQIMYASPNDDGSDRISGGPLAGVGNDNADLVDYSGRTQSLTACLSNSAAQCPGGVSTTSGQAGEADDLGNSGATPDVEMVYGGPANDTFTGNDQINELRGLGGDDTLKGLGNNDLFFGGLGDDYIYGDAGDDAVYGLAGNDCIDGGTNSSIAFAPGDTIKYGRSPAAVQVDLRPLTDATAACPAWPSGTLAGTATGGEGNDALLTTEQVQGTNYPDSITGDDARNVLTGGGGNDTLVGGANDDTLNGAKGNDFMDGGAGFDQVTFAGTTPGVVADVSAQDANCVAVGSPCAYRLVGGSVTEIDKIPNVEWLIGTGSNDTLTGDGNGNRLDGGAGDDFLSGLAGGDRLNGAAGNDTLDGGDGADTLDCGDGADRYKNGETVSSNCETAF